MRRTRQSALEMAEEKKEKRRNPVTLWVAEARLQDITYHRTRQQIWGKLCKLIKNGELELEKELFRSIKSALTCRSQDMDDNKKLAFETALDEIEEQFVDDAENDEGDEAAEAPKAPS